MRLRKLVESTVLLGMLSLAAVPVAAQQPLEASLSFVSQPGEYVGGGQSRSFTLDTASIVSSQWPEWRLLWRDGVPVRRPVMVTRHRGASRGAVRA